MKFHGLSAASSQSTKFQIAFSGLEVYLHGVTQLSVAQRLEARFQLASQSPSSNSRCLALYATAVALADEDALQVLVQASRSGDLSRTDLYEIVLQSYLFLGFPRMLIAAENLAEHWPYNSPAYTESNCADFDNWKIRGLQLYSDVYGTNATKLRERVEAFAPEVFEWMVLEGYGKVLSRPGLDMATRELAIVAFLTIEARPKQLTSHIRGALRMGVQPDQLRDTIADIEIVAPQGASMARTILTKFGDAR